MHIAVLGAGKVGSTLGRRLAGLGHQIAYGARTPDSATALAAVAATPGSSAGTPADVVVGAELVLLAVPWPAVPDALAGAGDLAGRVLVDATNPLGPGLALAVAGGDSGGEAVARLAPGAAVVKAFNTVGTPVMDDPLVGGVPAFLPVCGEDEPAGEVAGLADQLGFDAEVVGPLATARLTEPFAALWITLAYQRGHGPGLAFGLHHR